MQRNLKDGIAMVVAGRIGGVAAPCYLAGHVKLSRTPDYFHALPPPPTPPSTTPAHPHCTDLMMLRAPAFRCCLPCNPSNKPPAATCSGEEDEEVVDVPHELTNVPYHSEPAPTAPNKPPSDQQTDAEPIDSSAEQQQNKDDNTTNNNTSSSATQAQGDNTDDAQKAAARLSYWGPPPYPPPNHPPPDVPVRDPARVLAESRQQLLQRQRQRLLDLHQQQAHDSGGSDQPCRRS